MSLEAPPPSRHISSTPISLTSASHMLETYLRDSERHPHLHPDALITPAGVSFSSHGGPMGGVVMHNLRRVAAGLRGEYLEPERTPEPEDGEGDNTEGSGSGKHFGKNGFGENKGGKKRKVGIEVDWQDKAEYEQEQAIFDIGEIGDRSHVVQDGGEEPAVEAAGRAQDKVDNGKLDKEARKRAKKERNKQQKRDQEKKRAEKAK